MNYKKQSVLFVALFISIVSIQAQSTKANNDPDSKFKLAKELFQEDKFSLAYPMFKELYADGNANSSIPVTIQVEAKYYSIVCGLQMNDVTAKEAAIEYIDLEHHEPRIQMMCFHLGEYYYRKLDFNDAITYYEQTSLDNLSNREIADMKFHEGYSYFTMQRFNDAQPLFDAIRQIKDDPNYYDANYYYGYIAFSKKDYNTALNSFLVVEKQPAYEKVLPYYITEIYYYKGEKDKALQYGETALQKGNQYYDLQMRQLIGHMYFEKKNYSKALPYLEKYITSTEKVSREDLYELSYCYYDAEKYRKAADGFKELGGKQDTLAQNSMYLLGDSFLKLGNKPGARNAFLFCALNSSSKEQKEISKFNYGKLSYELGYLDIALDELKEYVAKYPRGYYNAEAKELLVSVLANTNNYNEALTLLNSLPAKTEPVKKVFPKVLYGRAVELINDQQIDQADALLNQIYTAEYNSYQLPYANFWKGEIAYRTNQFDSAIYYLQQYMKAPVSYGEVNPLHARYTLGYSSMRQQDYVHAQQYFEQITTSVSSNSSATDLDAYIRTADCYFMQKKMPKALQMYETAINYQLPASDYALYQKAVIAGASDQPQQKITILQSIAQRFPSSTLLPDANMEIANTYLAGENYTAAIVPLSAILQNKTAEALKPQAYLKMGVSYFNLNNNTEALNNFKQLIKQYPNSEESDEGVDYVRSIFVENQRPGEFVAFMRQNGKDVSYSEEDSLTYISANIAYENKAYDNAFRSLNEYLTKFPDGRYSVEANYQCASILNDKKDFINALKYYTKVAQKAPNKYAEPSVLQAARINYFEIKDYKQAEQYFAQLKTIAASPENKQESMRGLLRCQYKLNEWTDAVNNAEELLQQKSIATDDKMMANMIIAKNYQTMNNLSEASVYYKTVVSLGKSEYGAEARYRIAEILLVQDKLSEAEKAAFEVINKAGSYDYWITKAYILLGDVYYKQEDYFNAEATLKSVIENATVSDLKQEAQRKLDIVIADKNRNSKIAQQ